MYGMGLSGGFCHLYIGQEAVVVGMQSAIEPGDSVITSYRDHGHMLACDMDPKGVMAELTGRSGGYSQGKGGPLHTFSQEKKLFGGARRLSAPARPPPPPPPSPHHPHNTPAGPPPSPRDGHHPRPD